MKIKRQREFASGLMFVAVGLWFAWAAGTWPLGSAEAPGPGFFGVCLALALTGVGGLVLFMSTTLETPGGDPLRASGLRSAAWVLGAMVGLGLLLPRLGLVGTVFVVTLAAGRAWHGRMPAGDPFAASGGRPATTRRGWRAAGPALAQGAANALLAWVVCHLLLAERLPLWPRPLSAWWP